MRNEERDHWDYRAEPGKFMYYALGFDTGRSLVPIQKFIPLAKAIVGDDRPAPNGDAWETEMLRLLSR